MSLASIERFIAIGKDKSARGVLGLGAGTLSFGIVEAALARRIEKVRSHPLSDSPEAARAIGHLEALARELELEISLVGEPSAAPVHPLAKQRIEAPSPQGSLAHTPVRPRGGVTEEQLTEFDRVVLTILVAGGGWNPRTAAQLAALSAEHGVSSEGLHLVVAGLAKFMRDGGAAALRKDLGSVGVSAEQLHAHHVRKPSAAEAAVDRITSSIGDEMRGRSPWSALRLTAFFGTVAVGITLAIVWMIVRGATTQEEMIIAPTPRVLAESASTQRERTAADLAQKFSPPDTNIEALAAPAKFARAPGFASSPTPAQTLLLSNQWPDFLTSLDELARKLKTNRGRLEGSNAAELASCARLAGESWAVSGAFRAEFVTGVVQLARAVHGDESARALLLALHGIPASSAGADRVPLWKEVWQAAFAAGLTAELLGDPEVGGEVAAAARESLRREGITSLANAGSNRFGVAAISSLTRDAVALADGTDSGSASVTLDDWSRWLEAVDAAGSTAKLREAARLAAMEALLHSAAPIDLQNTASDALGRLMTDIDWSNRGVSGDQARTAFGAWFANPSILATRLWVLTSMLDRNHRIGWFSPEMVLPVDANVNRRDAALQRILAAWPKSVGGVEGERLAFAGVTVELLRSTNTELSAHAARPQDDIEALAIANGALQSVLAVRLLEAGKSTQANAALESATDALKFDRSALEAPFSGDGGLRPSGIKDGEWATEFAQPGLNAESRQRLIASLRALPAAGDLGPRDAEVLARESFQGNAADIRREAQGAIADKFASGRTVLLAVLDALTESKPREEFAGFLAALLNREFTGRDWIPIARAALVDRILSLESSREAAVDRLAARLAASAVSLTAQYAPNSAPTDLAPSMDTSIAMLATALRANAEERFLSEPFPASPGELDRLRIARRGLAEGAMQRAVADAASLLEHATAIEAARRPQSMSALREILAETMLARSQAQSASAQLAITLCALARVSMVNVESEAVDREDAA